MGDALFSFDRTESRIWPDRCRNDEGHPLYRGDLWTVDGQVVSVRTEAKDFGPVTILRQRATRDVFFRRTRRHIREDGTDLSILCFAKYGTITYSNPSGRWEIRPSGFALTRSLAPFVVECRVDGDSVFELMHVAVPTHVLRDFVPCDFEDGLFFPARRAELAIAENLLTDLFEDEGALGEDAARVIVETALTLIGTVVRNPQFPPRPTVIERRQEDLLRFIEVHLSNPRLSPAMAARGCGISPRYLSTLLQLRGTSFSEVVWDQRLAKARQFLSSPAMRETSIAEIAYGLGFKSPAHFSRMFKRVFQINPREFRNASEAAAQAALAAGSGFEPVGTGGLECGRNMAPARPDTETLQ